MVKATHSPKFAIVKKYYNTFKPDGTRMWTTVMVKNAVVKGWITEAEYAEVVGEPYKE